MSENNETATTPLPTIATTDLELSDSGDFTSANTSPQQNVTQNLIQNLNRRLTISTESTASVLEVNPNQVNYTCQLHPQIHLIQYFGTSIGGNSSYGTLCPRRLHSMQ